MQRTVNTFPLKNMTTIGNPKLQDMDCDYLLGYATILNRKGFLCGMCRGYITRVLSCRIRNKYMAMGPSGARCQEWPCWLVASSKLLLCSALGLVGTGKRSCESPGELSWVELSWEFSSVGAVVKRRLYVWYLECVIQWKHCQCLATVKICYPATTSAGRYRRLYLCVTITVILRV
jgi:hypothetical protein